MESLTTLLLVAVLVTSPVDIVLVHVVFQRARPSAPPQRICLLACAFGMLPVGALTWLASARDGLSFAYAAIIYVCVAYSYFGLFNMGETARRIRLIREIDRAGSMLVEDLRNVYSDDEVVGRRLARTVEMGHFVERDGKYFVGSPILLFAARVVAAWRSLLGFPALQTKRVE